MDSKEYWNNRYKSGGNSGYGSYDAQLERKLTWLSGLQISSISDIGCGDFNLGSHLLSMYPGVDYVGSDISEFIIDRNQKRYPRLTFTTGEVPEADLVLCIDVLFHVLNDDDLKNLLDLLHKKWTRYLAVTAYERNEDLGNHVRIREFLYKEFGEPVIREVVEEDGQLYFYLFKKPFMSCDPGPTGTLFWPKDLRVVTCCLNTKEATYPKEVLDHVSSFNFGEILIKLNSKSPSEKQDLFRKAKHSWIYYQDDDAICPIQELVDQSQHGMMNVAIKPEHFEQYKDQKMLMGLGWGAIFPKHMVNVMDTYIKKYGKDIVYQREDTRIMTYLNYPQNRLILPIKDLPSAFAEDRLWRQHDHYNYIPIVEERCKTLTK